MSIVSVRQALESALNGITPSIDTVWENTAYKPVTGTEYQAVYMLYGDPLNPVIGSDFYRETGFMQIDLMYPVEKGTLPSQLRAELIRTTFKRGASFIDDGVTVHIDKTPAVDNGFVDGDRYKTIIRVFFHADVC